jgi:hypothetical protein
MRPAATPKLIGTVLEPQLALTPAVAGNALDSALVGGVRRLSVVDRGHPATEELQRLLEARAGLGGVGEDRQPLVCGEVQTVEAQAENGTPNA